MPKVTGVDKARREATRPTEDAALLLIAQEAKHEFMGFRRFILTCRNAKPKPVVQVIVKPRVIEEFEKLIGYRITQPLYAFKFGGITDELLRGMEE